MKVDNPTDHNLSIANVIIAEATTVELLQGFLDGYYTMRQLVQRMHDTGTTKNWRTAIINEWRMDDDNETS